MSWQNRFMSRWGIIKIVFSVSLLAVLLWLADRREVLDTLRSVSLPFVALVTVAYLGSQILSSYKWFLITRAAGLDASLAKACKAYLLGMFANFFGLGVVGGDVARGLLIARGGESKSQAVATVIADRAHGLAVLAAIGVLACLIWGHSSIPDTLLFLIIAFGVTICLSWVFGPWLLLRIVKPDNRFRIKAEKIADAFPKDRRLVFKITLISIVFHLWQIYIHLLIVNELMGTIKFSALLVSVPFVNILSSLPISWNGLGVREAGYVFFLSPELLSQEIAISMGAIWLLSTTLSNMFGGLLAVFTGDYNKIRAIVDTQ